MARLPLWIGAVTYDRSVGLSHRTGQITHHIGADIDAERDGLFADLGKNGWLTEEFQVTGVGATLLGRNGGGDRYYTDGELTIGVLGKDQSRDKSPSRLENPVPVQIKDQLWSVDPPADAVVARTVSRSEPQRIVGISHDPLSNPTLPHQPRADRRR